jgi:hypothetical protein
VEITLPPKLRFLIGTQCQFIVREGSRPEVVLQPDFTAAQNLFQSLWHKIQIGLGEIGDIPGFSLADFTPAFFSYQHWQKQPTLSYADALIIIQQQDNLAYSSSSHFSKGKHQSADDKGALARVLASLVVNASYHLGLQRRYALAFGDTVAYLTTGDTTSLGADFERGMAHRIFWSEVTLPQSLLNPFEDRSWQQARSGFRKVFDQLLDWQENPKSYTVARNQWCRALTVELTIP